MSNISYNKEYFNIAKEKANATARAMTSTLDSVSKVRSSIVSGISVGGSIESALSNIEAVCIVGERLNSIFSSWQSLVENSDNIDWSFQFDMDHSGAYENFFRQFFGVDADLSLDFHPGYNYVNGPSTKTHEGGYVVYIPENYNSNTSVQMSVLFHSSGINGSIENDMIAQKLKQGTYKPNSIIIIPRAGKKAYDLKSGSTGFANPGVQSWVMELMEKMAGKYNINPKNISLTAYSSSEHGAIEMVYNNSGYFTNLNLVDTLAYYDYLENDTAIGKIKEISEGGIDVNLYHNHPSAVEAVYGECENVTAIKANGDHAEIIQNVYNSDEFLALIGGANTKSNNYSTVKLPDINVDENISSEVLTLSEEEKISEDLNVKEIENVSEKTYPNVSVQTSSKNLNTEKVAGTKKEETESHSSKVSNTQGVSSIEKNILPDNTKFSNVIPKLNSGTLEFYEINKEYVKYEINNISNNVYNDYLNLLKNSGFVLSEDGTKWIKDNYSLIIDRNSDSMTISIYDSYL